MTRLYGHWSYQTPLMSIWEWILEFCPLGITYKLWHCQNIFDFNILHGVVKTFLIYFLFLCCENYLTVLFSWLEFNMFWVRTWKWKFYLKRRWVTKSITSVWNYQQNRVWITKEMLYLISSLWFHQTNHFSQMLNFKR